MSGFSSSVPAPEEFCSPGLRKLLVRLEIATEEQIDQCFQNRSNAQVLTALEKSGAIEQKEALELLAAELSIPLSPDLVDDIALADISEFLEIVTVDVAIRHRFLPFAEKDGEVRCAMSDPLDIEALQQAEFKLQKRIVPELVTEDWIVSTVDRVSQMLKIEQLAFDQISEIEGASTSLEVMVAEATDEAANPEAADAPPIVRLVNRILADAASMGASDVHIEPTSGDVVVRLRIDGVMRDQLNIPKRLQPYVLSRVKLLSGMDITEKRRPQDGRLRIRLDKKSVRDIRASSVPTPYGEKLVLRLLRPSSDSVSFDSIGMAPEVEAKLKDSLNRTDRIVIVTGPTGSGKSTTLYSAVSHLNRGTNTIITVEDPIEFRIKGATQIEVNEKVGVTFASGLRSILRQDPDVILVGEIRDLETAEIAFQAAQTGHLVLSTLHTNDAPSALTRLRDLGLEPYVIAGSLAAILAQRLVRRICEDCCSDLPADKLAEFNSRFGISLESAKYGRGCQSCGNIGYKGRVGLFSLLQVNSEIRELMRSEASVDEIAKAGRNNGMEDIFESGIDMVRRGITSFEEIERVIGFSLSKAHDSVPVGEVAEPVEVPVQAKSEPEKAGDTVSIADLAASFNESSTVDTKKRILVIDDDDGVRAVMAASFRKAGFDVNEAVDGRDALNVISESSPDAVVCDLMMPGMNGEEFVGELRKNSEYDDIPVLMLTGMDSEEKEMQLLELGASDFISKASSPALVITRVKRILR